MPEAPFIRAIEDGIELTLKVVPGASRSRIVGALGGALKVQIAAAPERGRANDAVLDLLCEQLGVARRQVVIVRGQTQARKIVRVAGITLAAARARLPAGG